MEREMGWKRKRGEREMELLIKLVESLRVVWNIEVRREGYVSTN
jgi:hypothetical protein